MVVVELVLHQYMYKLFRIDEVLPLTSRTIKDAGRRIPQAEVSAFNVPITAEVLRQRLGVRPSQTTHIFAAHIDTPSSNILIITGK